MQVFDFYKRSNSEQTPAKATAEDLPRLIENQGLRLLGQIRHGSCRPRAVLFKVLADAVGLQSKLVVVRSPFILILVSWLAWNRLSHSRN